jgi:hypothetical protein
MESLAYPGGHDVRVFAAGSALKPRSSQAQTPEWMIMFSLKSMVGVAAALALASSLAGSARVNVKGRFSPHGNER